MAEDNLWKKLNIFGSKARVHILRFLLECEMASLSDVVRELGRREIEITISGVFKHMRILEKAGLVRHESGGLKLEEPDARKTIYMVEGKKRVEKILQLQEQAVDLMNAGLAFKRTAQVAHRVQGIGPRYKDEVKLLESCLNMLENEVEVINLTEDEKEKMRLWRMITGTV